MTPMDATLLESLSKHLKSELGIHRQLLGIAEGKRDTIVSGDIQEFSSLLKKEQEILNEGHKLREVREGIMNNIADDLHIELTALHMSKILEMAPDPLRSELSGLQGDLRSLLEKLRDINDRNMVLIRQSLSFVKEILNYVTGANETKAYSQNGDQENNAGGGKIFNAEC